MLAVFIDTFTVNNIAIQKSINKYINLYKIYLYPKDCSGIKELNKTLVFGFLVITNITGKSPHYLH